MYSLAHLSHIGTLGRRGSSAIQLPDFFIPLTSSLALSRGVGSPTFTRNTTATVWGYDNSGNWTLLTIPSGVPRFEGARWTGSAWTDTFPDGSKIPDATLKGYLVEGQRTNLLMYSEQFNNAYWQTASNITVTGEAAVSPSGITTADMFIEANTSATHRVSANNNYGVTIVSGSPYTLLAYFKKGTRRYHILCVSDSTGVYQTLQWFDLDNGVLGTNSTLGTQIVRNNASIASVGNGWYRAALTFNPTGINLNSLYCFIGLANADGSNLYAGSTSQYGYFWGAQLEQASFASSYAATTNTTTTINADVLSYLSSLFSDTAGTAYVELTPLSWVNVAGGIIGDGSKNIIAPSYAYGAYAYDGVNTANGPSMSPSEKVKAAIRWGNGKMRVFANGIAANESNYDGAFLYRRC